MKDFENITIEELDQVPQLENMLKETLRMFPVVLQAGRKLTEDITFGNYTVPRDTLIVPQYGIFHYDEKYYKNPHSFCPARFTGKGTYAFNL